MFKAYDTMGIKQLIQDVVCVDRTIINNDKNNFCVISFNRIRLLKKWPEVDLDYLGIIGNVIGEEYLKEKKKNDR